METFQIDKKFMKSLYDKGSKEIKDLMIGKYGAGPFTTTVMERVTSFEDALEETGLSPFEVYSEADSKDEKAYKKLKLIASLLREEWWPDWNDKNQQKWFPIFKYSAGSGFGFSLSGYGCDLTTLGVGSRLCFPTEKLANYFGEHFIDIHRDLLNP